jgi:hypothetical protein
MTEDIFGDMMSAFEGAGNELVNVFSGPQPDTQAQDLLIFEKLNESDIDALMHHYGPEAVSKYLEDMGGRS